VKSLKEDKQMYLKHLKIAKSHEEILQKAFFLNYSKSNKVIFIHFEDLVIYEKDSQEFIVFRLPIDEEKFTAH
jgi:hypothetical protein